MKYHALTSSLLGVLLAACAAPRPRPPPAPGPPGTIAVQVQDHLAWPYALERVLVVVDGEVELDRSAPARARTWTARIRAVPGEHTIQTLVAASYATGTLGEACHTKLRLARSYRLGGAGASVVIDVHLGGPWRDFARRVDVTYVARGLLPPDDDIEAAPSPAEARCAQPDPVEATLCRTDARIAEATRERDVVKLFCYRDKRAAMQRAASARQPGYQQRIAGLWQELEQCVGEDVAIMAPFTPARETDPACSAPAPLPGLAEFDDPSPLLGW